MHFNWDTALFLKSKSIVYDFLDGSFVGFPWFILYTLYVLGVNDGGKSELLVVVLEDDWGQDIFLIALDVVFDVKDENCSCELWIEGCSLISSSYRSDT